MQITDERFFIAYLPIFQPTSTVGTTMSDFMDPTLGVVYATGTALLIGILPLTLGTALGVFLTKPHAKGGLDFGTVGSSAVLGGVLLVLVLMASWYQRREPRQALEMS